MKKKLAIAVLSTLCVLLAGYTLFWFWMAGRIEAEAHALIKQAAQDDVTVITRALAVKGFPGEHTVVFDGRLSVDGVVMDIPVLTLQSRFLPGSNAILDMPQGIALLEPVSSKLWSLDALHVDAVIPETFPDAPTHEDLAAWQSAGGTLTVNAITVRKQDLRIQGSGAFVLDENLQPSGVLDTKITGHMDFLRWLQDRRYVETRESLLAAAVLGSLSEPDEDSGEDAVKIQLTLQNRTLFAGPLRLAVLPTIDWLWSSEENPRRMDGVAP